MKRFAHPAILSLTLVAGCSAPHQPANDSAPRDAAGPSDNETAAPPPAAPPAANAAVPAPAGPAAPGTRGGLSDDRTPVAEAPFSEKSAQGAADIVQRYFALVEAHRYAEARRLWDRGGDASGKTAEDFAADFGHYRDYHGDVGAPGRIEGAAGSSFIEVPVQLHGHLKDGTAFRQTAKVTLRRVNDVPGSTEEQRRWHISDVASDEAPEG